MKDKEDSGIKVDVGGGIKGLENILGGLGNIVEAAKNLGNLTEEQRERLEDVNILLETNGNEESLTEEQRERFAMAKERLAERGETVFGNGKIMGSYGLNTSFLGGRSPNDKVGGSVGGSSTWSPKPHEYKKPVKKVNGPKVETGNPNIDIFNENNSTHVVIDIPGVEEKDIDLQLKDNTLSLNIGGKRKYKKDINIPKSDKSKTMTWTYNNGILDIEITGTE